MSRLFAFAGICSLAALLAITVATPQISSVDTLIYKADTTDVEAMSPDISDLKAVVIAERSATERTRMPPLVAHRIQKSLEITSRNPPAYRHIDPGRRGA